SHNATSAYRVGDGAPTYRAYASSAINPKKVDRVSLRSIAHATDSTCKGCRAKSAATTALGHLALVTRLRNRNRSTLFATWISALTSKCLPASRPNIWAMQASGCQFES